MLDCFECTLKKQVVFALCMVSGTNIWTCILIYSLWSGDAIWRHKSASTFVQAMVCCLTVASHYINQFGILMQVFCAIYMGRSARYQSPITVKKNYKFQITGTYPTSHWVETRLNQVFKGQYNRLGLRRSNQKQDMIWTYGHIKYRTRKFALNSPFGEIIYILL